MSPRRHLTGLAIAGLIGLALALILTRVVVPLFLPAPAPPPRRAVAATAPRATSRPPAPAPPASPPRLDASARSDLDAQPDSSPRAAPPPAAPPRRPEKRAGLLSTADIVRLGPGRYRLRRAALDDAIAKGGAGGTTARPVVEPDGRVVGYRLGRVSPSLGRLGLRNGDVVTDVNGVPIDSPDAALRAYGSARKAPRVRVGLRRGGRRAVLRYDIVE